MEHKEILGECVSLHLDVTPTPRIKLSCTKHWFYVKKMFWGWQYLKNHAYSSIVCNQKQENELEPVSKVTRLNRAHTTHTEEVESIIPSLPT
jgi:hypothetical protein